MDGDNHEAVTRAEALRRQLADAIITGALRPGVRLDEQEIAQAHGLSRTPVREALRQLTAIGLAEHRPHKGVIVAAMSEERLSQTFEAMSELEGLCAKYCALRMSAGERRELELLHQRSAELVREGDPEIYDELNTQFHTLIYRGSHNAALEEMVLATRRRLAPYRRGQFRLLGRLALSFAEHGRVVEAILRGEAQAAAEAMLLHVSIVKDASARYVSGRGETLASEAVSGAGRRAVGAPAAE